MNGIPSSNLLSDRSEARAPLALLIRQASKLSRGSRNSPLRK